MHELGIVFHIIRSVESLCVENNITKVSKVTLELGEVSGVIPHYLTDAWKWAAAKHEVVQGAELCIEDIPAITFCENCKSQYKTLEHGKSCPSCGSTHTYLLQGQEVMIKEIEVAEEASEEKKAPTESKDAVDAANPMRIDS